MHYSGAAAIVLLPQIWSLPHLSTSMYTAAAVCFLRGLRLPLEYPVSTEESMRIIEK